jgi:hypothetical protein
MQLNSLNIRKLCRCYHHKLNMLAGNHLQGSPRRNICPASNPVSNLEHMDMENMKNTNALLIAGLIASLALVACGPDGGHTEKSRIERVKGMADKAERAAYSVLPELEPVLPNLELDPSTIKQYIATSFHVYTAELETMFAEYSTHCDSRDQEQVDKALDWLTDGVDLLSEIMPKGYAAFKKSGLKDEYLVALLPSLSGLEVKGIKADLISLLNAVVQSEGKNTREALLAFHSKHSQELEIFTGAARKVDPLRAVMFGNELKQMVQGYEQRIQALNTQMHNLSQYKYSPKCQAKMTEWTSQVMAKLKVELAKI